MSNILITGGAGYIGSMLATELINIGHQVTIVDLLKYNKSSLNHLISNKKFKLIVKDIRNTKLIKKLLKKHEYIIPLAALVGAPLCEKYKKEATTKQIYGCWFLFWCNRVHTDWRFVFASATLRFASADRGNC